MGRPTVYKIGTFYGKLEILNVIPSIGTGHHVKLNCLCHYCGETKIMDGVRINRLNSCGCQQRNSDSWKNKTGPKNRPWQLPDGEAARRDIYATYKGSSVRRNLEFALTEEQFMELVLGHCFYCGDHLTQIKKGQGKTSGDFYYTGIDRVDSSKGYTITNCVSCCYRCNLMKHKFPQTDFFNQIKKIYSNHQGIFNSLDINVLQHQVYGNEVSQDKTTINNY